MNYGFIYETTNIINNKKYIGSHVRTQDPNDPDDSWYLGSGKIIGYAINKYGKENFRRVILKECIDQNDLKSSEAYYLNSVDAANNPNYYNLINNYFGGDARGENSRMYGKRASLDTRKKHSDYLKKNNPMYKEDARIKISLAQKGKPKKPTSESTKEKLRIAGTEYMNSPEGLALQERLRLEYKGSGNPFFGKNHTDESKEKCGAANRGSVYVHKGEINRRINPEELPYYESLGFVKGMFKRKKGEFTLCVQ